MALRLVVSVVSLEASWGVEPMELNRPMVKVVTGNPDSRTLDTTDLAHRQIPPTLRIIQTLRDIPNSIIPLAHKASSSPAQLVTKARLLMVLHLLKEGIQLQASTRPLPRAIHPLRDSTVLRPRDSTTQVLTKLLVDPVVILLTVALAAINPLPLPLGPRVTVPLEATKVARSTNLPPLEAPTRERPHRLSTSLQGVVGIILLPQGTNLECK